MSRRLLVRIRYLRDNGTSAVDTCIRDAPEYIGKKFEERITQDFQRKQPPPGQFSNGQFPQPGTSDDNETWIDLTHFGALWGPVVELLEKFLQEQGKKMEEAARQKIPLHMVSLH